MSPADMSSTMLPPDAGRRQPSTWSPRAALTFVLLFAAANLFADMSYEGARSVAGPFLGTLGASGPIVGAVAGFGELLGDTLRYITMGGPQQALLADHAPGLRRSNAAGSGARACGKLAACRGPHRTRAGREGDAHAAVRCDVGAGRRAYGRGWAFGVNEALDQLGAMIGPLVVAAALAWRHNFQVAFALLAVPAVITLSVVFASRCIYPNAGRVARGSPTADRGGYAFGFWCYAVAAGLVGSGFADFSLLAYHFSRAQSVASTWIPVFYALAMGAGGLGSLMLGELTTGALAADPPLVSSIYKAPVAVREPAPWTGLYGGLNAGYGWGNQPVRETGDAVTDGQQAVNAGAIPASLAGRPTGFLAGGQLGVSS